MSFEIEPKFKFKDLRTYSSTEWLAENKKKYRQVFDRYETSYVYAELCFYNKMFDIEDWDADIVLKCFSNKRNAKEICELPLTRRINKFDAVFYVREGWGAKKEGFFWKKGSYYWEAWINGEKVGEKTFYIEDAGKNEDVRSSYLAVSSVRLYEGPYEDVSYGAREYMKVFNSEETRYVYVELEITNILATKNWQCELFIKFFNGARELKGQVIRLLSIDKMQDTVSITAGWGANVKGSWRPDDYTVEIVFMDKLLVTVPFEVADYFEQGISGAFLPGQYETLPLPVVKREAENFEEVMKNLDALIGLQPIKRKVRDHAQYIQFLQLRREKGFVEKETINIHSVFYGNPGTGKTTVAKMMGMLYKRMGLLSKGHVHEVDRVDLVGEYIGQTAPKVKEAIDKARGGVLFIDEAYSLARSNDDSKDFGREVIEILIKEMSDGEGDMAVIVAGYPKEMQHFLDSNPGLKSRFKLFFEFPDYLPQELAEIAHYAASEKEVKFSPIAKEVLDKLIVDAYRRRDRTFGNARYIYDLVEQAKINLGLRIMSLETPRNTDKETLAAIDANDVEKIQIKAQKGMPNIPVDESMLRDSILELQGLIGMHNVKKQIEELVQLVRYHRETSKSVLNKFFLHTVFVGNPGTGKTTVARILTKIYKALGILERGHMVETDRQGLVAGYIGQTAIKTSEKIDEAMGGVLFIDEAYALTQNGGANGDYGGEAIQTLLKRMEDQRGEFFIFVAGYPENMDTFMKANPGLRSRFDKVLKFEDYNDSELYEIAAAMFKEENLTLTDEATAHIKNYLTFQYELRDKYFGNARTVRNIVTETVKNQNLRLAATAAKKRTVTLTNLITIEDVKGFKLDKDADSIFTKKGIGFQKRPHGMADNS